MITALSSARGPRGAAVIAPRPSYQYDNVVTLPVAHVIPADGGGWLVVTHRGHAWLHGDRLSAIRDKKWLDDQWRGRA